MKKLLLILISLPLVVACCNTCDEQVGIKLKEVEFAQIEGAPKFQQPQFLASIDNELLSVEKYGYAYPAIYDWDGDGLQDLFIGEFGGGKAANLKVFKNMGSNEKPEFATEGFYATDKKGDTLYIEGS